MSAKQIMSFVSVVYFEAKQVRESQNLHGWDIHYMHIPITLNILEGLKYTSLPKRSPELQKVIDEKDQDTITKLEKSDPYFLT